MIIFWFLLIGPGGALGYKILDYFVFTKDLRIDQKSRNNIKGILALIEFTFHETIFINYMENEVPQPQEDEAWGLVILKEEPINSVT